MDFTLAPDLQPYFVIGILLVMFFLIYTEWIQPTVSFLLAVVAFIILGILSPGDVLIGFSNQSIASVVILVLITAGIRSNFNTERLLDRVFGRVKSYRGFLAGMLTKVAVLSSFVNNTPVVVLMTPYVFEWGKNNRISPSKLLIPLSYATIVGGMITLIGTSTTLVLNGFMLENGIAGLHSLDLLLVGASVALSVILFMVIFAQYILPDNKDLIEDFKSNQREYLIEKRLAGDSGLIGKTVAEGRLRNLSGVYLVEIVRADEIISPVRPQEVIEKDDILIFAGKNDPIVDLKLKELGIIYPEQASVDPDKQIRIVEGVISANSSINGKTVKESDFRERYDAAVVAVHRNGEPLSGKIGNIKLRAGDVLLMYAGDQFFNRADLYKDIYVISGDQTEIQPRRSSVKRLTAIAVISLLLLVTQAFNLFTSLLIIFVLMSGMKLITVKNIKRDLDINMVAILVLSISIGEAIIRTGTGEVLAHEVIRWLQPYGSVAILAGVMVFTTLLTSFITNVGAVAITFPVVLAVTNSMGIDGTPFYLGLAYAASAAFLTPIGYQTNLIVFGPGGYRFRDFLRFGFPVVILYLAVAMGMIVFLYRDLMLK